MMLLWGILTFVLLIKILVSSVAIAVNLRYLAGRKIPFSDSNGGNDSGVRINILIPLLREQAVLPSLFERMQRVLTQFPQAYVYFVTTERELIESSSYGNCHNTGAMLDELIASSPLKSVRISRLHFPKYNEVVAEQLNFALSMIPPQGDRKREYVAVYNADSVLGLEGFEAILERAKSGSLVSQQSSLFLWNVPLLFERGAFFTANHGLYQSCWTLQHELTRYMFSRKFFPLLPKWLEEHSLAHCVGHGLLIRQDVLEGVGGFPVCRFGLEDLALGFVLKVNGFHIDPISELENSETPSTPMVLWRQLAGWFLGTVGYLLYWREIHKDARKLHRTRLVAGTALGVWDSLKWLLKGPLILFYLSLSILNHSSLLSVSLLFVYFYGPLFTLFWLWSRLPEDVFPRSRPLHLWRAALTYWLVPIARSGPAWLGLWWAVKIAVGRPFSRPKTER
jgi:hypothetical protein